MVQLVQGHAVWDHGFAAISVANDVGGLHQLGALQATDRAGGLIGAVTTETVWILDAKRYKANFETRGGGLFSTRAPELYVGGRNQMKLIDGVKRQVETVRSSCPLWYPSSA